MARQSSDFSTEFMQELASQAGHLQRALLTVETKLPDGFIETLEHFSENTGFEKKYQQSHNTSTSDGDTSKCRIQNELRDIRKEYAEIKEKTQRKLNALHSANTVNIETTRKILRRKDYSNDHLENELGSNVDILIELKRLRERMDSSEYMLRTVVLTEIAGKSNKEPETKCCSKCIVF